MTPDASGGDAETARRRGAGVGSGAAGPGAEPIGRLVVATAKALSRGFSDRLAAAGGSIPVWLVLLELKQGSWRTQQQLAAAVGIEGPTLTHHLDSCERAGLIERSRDPADRRVVRVELTPAGEELFARLVSVARDWDRRLREGLEDEDLEGARRVLARLRENAS